MGELLKDWQARVGKWVDAKLIPAWPAERPRFGMIRGFANKTLEETMELRNEVLDHGLVPDHTALNTRLQEEAADVVITVMATLHALGLSLEAGLQRKLPILESGDWYYNTELGVFKRRK